LKKLLPFTSEDIDFKGNGTDVQRIADQLNLSATFPPKVAMTALAGAVPFRIGNVKSNIEVIRQVPGVSSREVDLLAVQAVWSGREIRVLDPISLLTCKIELALMLPQTQRRDVAHLRILVFCVRGFLREVLAGVESKHLPAKGWLGAANKILKVSTSAKGRKVAKRFDIDWFPMMPLEEIEQSNIAKIVNFREMQLPHWLTR
jgi:hypothetical protein